VRSNDSPANLRPPTRGKMKWLRCAAFTIRWRFSIANKMQPAFFVTAKNSVRRLSRPRATKCYSGFIDFSTVKLHARATSPTCRSSRDEAMVEQDEIMLALEARAAERLAELLEDSLLNRAQHVLEAVSHAG
jgi:hypothetical protein